jgi:hypothetical protein
VSKVKLASGQVVLAVLLSAFFAPQPTMARDAFHLPVPDLSQVDSCIRKTRGNKVAAADCFDPYLAICQTNYSSRMSECLPQEVDFWRKAVDEELSRISGATAKQVQASISGDITEHCISDVATYREACRRMVYHQAAVYLRIARLWK